jgi:hypothetical protein
MGGQVSRKILLPIVLSLITVACGGGAAPANPRSRVTLPQARHVFLVIEENHSYSTVYPSGMPWLSALGDKYGIATNYYSNDTGSLLDYLWLSSGSAELSSGCDGNGCKTTISTNNIFRELNGARLSWNVYADSLPAKGYMSPKHGNYVKRHNPAAWYSDIVNSAQQQQNIVPFSQFAQDLKAGNLPDYALIVPDLKHDAHNGTMAAADHWLKSNVGPLLTSAYFQPGGDSVLFITFDNGDNDAQGQVFTAVIGQKVVPGIQVATPFQHQNTLRTMMELLGLKRFPGASAAAAPMREFFQ